MTSIVEVLKLQVKNANDFEYRPNQLLQFLYVHGLLRIMLPTRFKFSPYPRQYGGSITIPTDEYLQRDNGSIHISPRSLLPVPLSYEVAHPTIGGIDKIPPEHRVEAIIRSHTLNLYANPNFDFAIDQETGILKLSVLPEDYLNCQRLGNDRIVGLAFYPLSFEEGALTFLIG